MESITEQRQVPGPVVYGYLLLTPACRARRAALSRALSEYSQQHELMLAAVFTDTGGDTVSGIVTVTVVPSTSSGGSYNHLSATAITGGDLRLDFLGIPGKTYSMEVTHDLTPPITWTPVVTNVAAANGLLVFTNTPTGGQSFYRTRYVP